MRMKKRTQEVREATQPVAVMVGIEVPCLAEGEVSFGKENINDEKSFKGIKSNKST